MIAFDNPLYITPVKVYTAENGWIVEIPPPPFNPEPPQDDSIERYAKMYTKIFKNIRKDEKSENLGIQEEDEPDISELVKQTKPAKVKTVFVFTDFEELKKFLLPYLLGK